MQITVSVTFPVTQKGTDLIMDNWTNEEAARLKKALADKQTKDAKFVREEEMKERGGSKFWDNTRDYAKRMVDSLNQELGQNLFEWRSPKSSEIEVVAAGQQNQSLLAKFDSTRLRIDWRVIPAKSGDMEIRVLNGELRWFVEGHSCTPQEAAEYILKQLTSTI